MHADMHIKKSCNMRILVEKLDTPVQATKWKKGKKSVKIDSFRPLARSKNVTFLGVSSMK